MTTRELSQLIKAGITVSIISINEKEIYYKIDTTIFGGSVFTVRMDTSALLPKGVCVNQN